MTGLTLVNPFWHVTAPPGSTLPTVESSGSNGIAASADISVTFPGGYVPLEDDFILLIPNTTSTGTIVAAADPAGWVNVQGSGGETNAGSALGMLLMYHWVTAGEEAATTLTYTCAGIFSPASETGSLHGLAIRGVNRTTPVDHFAFNPDATAGATPHLTPLLAGASLSNGSLVVGGICKDGSGSYGTQNPSGWAQILSTDGTAGRWTGRVTAGTVAGVDVPAATLTPAAGDEYIGWALALAPI